MPELAAIYALGLIFGLLETALFLFLWKRRRRGTEFSNVRANLAKANLYWSESRDRLGPPSPAEEADDMSTSLRTIGLTGALLSFLSWPGAFFFALVMVSYRFFARSRLEKRLFDSPLSRRADLAAVEVASLVIDIQNELGIARDRP